MKTRIADFSDNGLFSMSRLGPEKLTHEALEDYLAKGRRLHSAYVCSLLVRLWRLIGSLLFQTNRWISSTVNSRRAMLAERIHGFSEGRAEASIVGAGMVSGTKPDTLSPAADKSVGN